MSNIRGKFIAGKKRKDGTARHEIIVSSISKSDRVTMIDLEDADEVEIILPRVGAIVQHPAEVVLSNTIEAAEELVTVLKNAYHMIKDAGSRGEALPNFDAKAEKVNNDLSSAVTVASDGPGPLEIILETEGEENGE